MFSDKSGVSLQTLLLITTVAFVSGFKTFTVTPDKDTSIYINSIKASSCKVCKKVLGSKLNRQCHRILTLNKNTRVTIEFYCPRPEEEFTVEIVRNIECNSTSCGRIIQSDGGFSGLLDFSRRFTWKIKAYSQKSFQINFAETGLRQIAPTDSCNDKHTYTLRAADVLLGKYCSSGPISNAQILNQGSFSLDLPAGQKPKPDQFHVSVGEKIRTIANISVTLLKGSSSTLMSPNYPGSFPDYDVMEWYFQVPNKHKAAIKFMNLTLPTCLKDQTGMEYSSGGKTQVVRLDEVQPELNEGSFSLRLRNCKMDTRLSGSAGLSVEFNVSAYQVSSNLKVILGAVAALFIIAIIVLLVVCIVIKKKKKELIPAVPADNPGNNVQPGPKSLPAGCEDENRLYATIDDSLVYSHLLYRQNYGVYDNYDSYQSYNAESEMPPIYEDVGGERTVSLFQSKQDPPLPKRAPSYMELMTANSDHDSEQRNEEEHPSTVEPRVELEREN
ncbi:CUB domain-containing protein 1a [Fundulus diaphanus]